MKSYLRFGMMMDPQVEVMLDWQPVHFIFKLHYLILVVFIFALQKEQTI